MGVPFADMAPGQGVLPGIVIKNTPDDGRPARGAVKVWIPHIHGPVQPDPDTLPESLVLFPWGGLEGTGSVMMPPVGASVMVSFLLGDMEQPIVLGSFYGAEEIPDQAKADKPDNVIVIQHPSGWVIKVDFETSRLEITHPSRNSIVLDGDGVKISRSGEQAPARLIHEFGIDTFTGAPLGQATGGATGAVRVSRSQ
jgi:hypothetical protein